MLRNRSFHLAALASLAASAMLTGSVRAQLGDESGASVDSSGSFEVSGVVVDVSAKTAEEARTTGWRIAQRKGWTMLSQRLTGRAGSLSDGALDGIVTGIVVENEQIGPTRYIARLGVLFSRARSAQILGVGGVLSRSPPMLVVPLQWSGGAGTVFERDTEWRDAWTRFRTGNSTIDYVRLAGTGPDPLLLNSGQVMRRGRGWWRTILDQYGAKDVLVPTVRLYREWPGGPIIGRFTAGHGPDNRDLTSFSLRVADANAINALLDEGIRRIDAAYQSGLRSGILKPDSLLSYTPPATEVEEEDALDDADNASGVDVTSTLVPTDARTTVNVQYDTPGVGAVASTEAAVNSIPGVRSALTSSLALGGVSVMRVTFDGDTSTLRAALEARGYQVQEGGGTLRIRRPAASPQPQQTVPEPTATDAPANQ